MQYEGEVEIYLIPSGDLYVMMDGMNLMQKLFVEKLITCPLLLKSKVYY